MKFIIGDIHGCYHTLVKLIDRIMVADSDATFVFVGDYMDRGLHSKEAVDYIIGLQEEGAVCIRGNHDEVIDWLLNKHCLTDIGTMCGGYVTDESVMSWWFVNGIKPTLENYGVDIESHFWNPSLWARQFRDVVPDSHKNFLKQLPLCWENDTHFACHAYIRPNEPLPREADKLVIPDGQKKEVIWERFPRGYKNADRASIRECLIPVKTQWDKIGVFGHTPVSYYGAAAPIKYDKLRLIDTGAFDGNYLCGYCCELDNWILQATDEKDIKKNGV